MKSFALCVIGCALFVSCETTHPVSAGNGGEVKSMDAVEALTNDGVFLQGIGEVSNDPSKTELPILKAVGAGVPKYQIMADGSYVAIYRYGKRRYFKIIGTRRTLAQKSFPPHSSMKVLGQTLPTYATGNEDPEFTSRDTVFTSPDGNSATFVFIHGGNRDFNTSAQIEKDVPKVIW